jgi:hypothetical protein
MADETTIQESADDQTTGDAVPDDVFEGAFEEEGEEETPLSTDETPAEEPPAEEPPPKKEVAKPAEEEAPPKEEADEDIARGKELLKAEEERKAASDKAKAEEEKAKGAPGAPDPYQHFMRVEPGIEKAFERFISPELLKGKMQVGDDEVDLGKYVEDNPEIPVLAGMIAYNQLQDLVNHRVLLPASEVQDLVARTHERIDGLRFELSLARALPAGVDPEEVVATPEFQDWVKKASDSEKALFRSSNPRDHAMGIKRFLRVTGKETEDKRKEVKDKAQAAKKEHASLYSSSRGRSSSPSTAEGAASDFEAGFSEGKR